MFFGKKFKAFSMVELMMVLLISALIIAAIVPIITRKHLQLPTVASHGAYLCYYGPKGIDDTTGEITDRTVVLREARWSGSGYTRKVFDRPTANCVFEPPKKAAFFQITAVGGGGGGSDSGYKGSVPTQTRTGDNEFDPFKISEADLNTKEINYNTFKANAGWVAAFTQARKSGKGGDMGWYKYQEEFNKGHCVAYYQKVKIQTNVGAPKVNQPIHHSQWKKIADGTPGTHGYWASSDGKKYIRENGPEKTVNEPCCEDIGAHHDPSNTCWSCYYEPGPCKEGSVDRWVWAQEVGKTPHYDFDGYTGWSDKDPSIPAMEITNINGNTECKITTPSSVQKFWPKCDIVNDNNCTDYDYDVCPTVESCPGFSTPDEPLLCSNYPNRDICKATQRTRKVPEEMRAPNGGYVSNEIRSTDSSALPMYSNALDIIYDVENCKYKLPKWKKHMVFMPCERENDNEVCNQIADPTKPCPRGTGEYEQICYEYDETKADGKGAKLSECPSDSDTWTWNNGIPPTSDEWKLEEWDTDNFVDPAPEYATVCPMLDASGNVITTGAASLEDYLASGVESTAEDPTNPTGSCKCKNSTTDEKIITYKRTDSDIVVGGAGGDGAKCATPFVPGDAQTRMLKYYDASNRTSGDYGGAWPSDLTSRAGYGSFFTAEEDGIEGNSLNVGGNRTIPELDSSEGWASYPSPNLVSIFAEYGYVPCAYANGGSDPNNKYKTYQDEGSCKGGRVPTWSLAKIEIGDTTPSDRYWTKASSASIGGGPGGRDEYARVSVNGTDGTFKDKDNNEKTGHITDVNGNEIEDPVRLNSPNSTKVSTGAEGVCASGGDYKNDNNVVSEVFNWLNNNGYGHYPYGYVLKHKDGTLEFAGKYRTYKMFDENEIAVGVAGEPGEAFTTLKRNIPADERTIVVGVGGSAAGMGSGAAGSPGSKTFMGSLIEVSGGAGGSGISSPIYFDYATMMGKVYNKVEYEAEDVCYFYEKFNKNPSLTTYMGRNRATIMGAYKAATCAAVEAAGYKYHILEGADMGDKPSYLGGIPTFNVSATSPIADSAFEYAGMGGQGGGVEHFCMTSQKIIVFEDKIDFKASVFRKDALNPGTPEYNSLFGSGAPFYGQDAGFSQVIPEHKIPRYCYRNDPGLKPAFNHVAAGNGKDGILLIRW